jgi:hypothetical protein
MSTVDDRAFELWAMETLEGNPTAGWEAIGSLWNNLKLAEQSVRERILQRMTALIAERGGIPFTAPAPKARALPQDIALFRKAAEYRRPSASNREIAMRIGVSEKTVRNWKEDYAFEFKLAGQKPGVPNSQIFSSVMWEPIPLTGEGKLTVNEHVIRAADRK